MRAGTMTSMQPLKATVKNGRLVLDEPTSLPEGEVMYLVALGQDAFDPEEHAALHDSLRESVEQMKEGRLIDADVALGVLRAHR